MNSLHLAEIISRRYLGDIINYQITTEVEKRSGDTIRIVGLLLGQVTYSSRYQLLELTRYSGALSSENESFKDWSLLTGDFILNIMVGAKEGL